ncbi:hypothetical protein AB2H94_26050 (plasmid) [Escherichia coli]
MTLNDFYADRFGSDPFSLIEAARDELTELAQMAGINWSACSDNIQLNPRGVLSVTLHTIKHLQKLSKRASKDA